MEQTVILELIQNLRDTIHALPLTNAIGADGIMYYTMKPVAFLMLLCIYTIAQKRKIHPLFTMNFLMIAGLSLLTIAFSIHREMQGGVATESVFILSYFDIGFTKRILPGTILDILGIKREFRLTIHIFLNALCMLTLLALFYRRYEQTNKQTNKPNNTYYSITHALPVANSI